MSVERRWPDSGRFAPGEPSDAPMRVHHFCRNLAISLELPVGWFLEQELATGSTFRHGDDLEEPESGVRWGSAPVIRRLILHRFRLAQASAGAHEGLIRSARASAETLLKEPVFISMDVDGLPASALIQHRRSGDLQSALHYQVFVQADLLIYSITGVGPASDEATLFPVFEAMVRSIRFIPVTRGSREFTAS